MGRYVTFNWTRLLPAVLLAAAPVALAAQELLQASAPVAELPAPTEESSAAPDVWDGYRAITDITLPFAGVARSAVVRIEANFVHRTETTLSALTTVKTSSAPIVTDPVLLDADRRLLQIETCRRQGLEICPILSVEGSGTGFIDNGHELYTCRHVVGDWPLAASLLNHKPLSEILPPLIVRDFEGRIIYNSAYSQNALRFSAVNDDPRLDSESILRYRALAGQPLPDSGVSYEQTLPYLLKASDFVGMVADEDLIPPVPLRREQASAAGEVFYLSGFPTRTGLLPKRYDGTPDTLLVSSVLTVEALGRSLPLLMARGLQRPGGSGGIVTTADGDVAGISCFADETNAYAFNFDASAQEKLWESLRNATFTDVFAVSQEAAARE